MLDQADARRHQEMLDRIKNQSASVTADVVPPPAGVTQPVMPTVPVADPYASIPSPGVATPAGQPAPDDTNTHVSFDPYPAMHQSVIAPIDPNAPKSKPPTNQEEKPGEKQVSPDIINLANNPDLSVETIAREANRIHEKEKLSEDEVVISLR